MQLPKLGCHVLFNLFFNNNNMVKHLAIEKGVQDWGEIIIRFDIFLKIVSLTQISPK